MLNFYLAHKNFGRWKFAISLDVVIGHHREQNTPEYNEYRRGRRIENSTKYFLNKHSLKSIKEGKKYLNKRPKYCVNRPI